MGDCFFIGLAPVLVHMAKNAQGKYSFHPVAVNLLVECTKLTFATAVLIANVRHHPATFLYRLVPGGPVPAKGPDVTAGGVGGLERARACKYTWQHAPLLWSLEHTFIGVTA